MPTTRSRVDCGLGLVILSFCPTMRLRSVDFPTFGLPTTVTIPALGITQSSPLLACRGALVGPTTERLGGVNPFEKTRSWGGRTRTCNFRINSPAVCQLTYTPVNTRPRTRYKYLEDDSRSTLLNPCGAWRDNKKAVK